MKRRLIAKRIKELKQSPRGRILAITGARQTGKSTLLKALFPEYQYISLDDPSVRLNIQKLTVSQLIKFYPKVIFDEVQKAPNIFELIKAAYDADKTVSFILSGSSQILLMKKISDSLAGRAALLELYPLSIRELISDSEAVEDPPEAPLLITLFNRLIKGQKLSELAASINPMISLSDEYSYSQTQWNEYLQLGGMPALTHYPADTSNKFDWLVDYTKTYLERDLSDLSKIDNLESFSEAQKVFAARSGRLINFSDFARIISVSPSTMKRYLKYLEISYQVLKLPAWSRNTEKRLSKMPKILFIDPGICRALLKRTGDVTGEEFEAAVAGEVYKLCKTVNMQANFYHLRTLDNREIDLLLEFETGYIGIESKQAASIKPADGRQFRNLEKIFDKPFLGGIIISNTRKVEYFHELNVLSLPAPLAFGLGEE